MTIQRQQKITIKDIARICNVSTQTVSRVLNNRPDVSPATRAAVEKAIAEMGYQPSALARSLVQQHSSMLGVITAGLRYSGVSQTLNGITEQCEASNYDLLLKELPHFDVADITPIMDSLIVRHVDGIIFVAPELSDNVQLVQAQMLASSPPIVFLKCQPSERYTTIGVDNYGGARRVVEHLLAIGRRRIGLITGPLEWLEARQRQQGWVDALAAAGIAIADEHWCSGNWSSASGVAAFDELWKRYHNMDAVFASNDQMALGVLHSAAALGLRVPDDLAVAGFDDLPEAAYFTPALTTVNNPLRELGILAVKTLLAQIEGATGAAEVQTLTLHTELMVRESTCARS